MTPDRISTNEIADDFLMLRRLTRHLDDRDNADRISFTALLRGVDAAPPDSQRAAAARPADRRGSRRTADPHAGDRRHQGEIGHTARTSKQERHD